MNDKPIHLRPSGTPHVTQSSVTCPVWITQDSLDGLHTLLTYISGLERNWGTVPGSHDVLMFYRTVRSAISEHYKLADYGNVDEFVEVTETA